MEPKDGDLVSPLEPHNYILDFYSEFMGTEGNKNLLVEEI
jgi:hypothetical protein